MPTRTPKLNAMCWLVSLALVSFGCAPTQTDVESTARSETNETQPKTPSEQQLQEIIAKAYERASQPPRYIQHVVAPDDDPIEQIFNDDGNCA